MGTRLLPVKLARNPFMLILPILIFWAPTPMRFSARLMRSLISSVLMIALFGPLVAVGAAAQGESGETFNPFRSHPGSQQSVPQDITMGDFSAAHDIPPDAGQTLAIGAIVPPTEGRFVSEGRHWYFTADYPEFAGVIRPAAVPTPTNVFRALPTRSAETAMSDIDRTFGSVMRQTNPQHGDRPVNPLREIHDERFAFDRGSAQTLEAFPEKMMIADDLILGRVIDRIQSGPIGDRWIVSGEVVERLGRAQLMIHAADRSGAEFPSSLK